MSLHFEAATCCAHTQQHSRSINYHPYCTRSPWHSFTFEYYEHCITFDTAALILLAFRFRQYVASLAAPSQTFKGFGASRTSTDPSLTSQEAPYFHCAPFSEVHSFPWSTRQTRAFSAWKGCLFSFLDLDTDLYCLRRSRVCV